jgi:cob(I)alamin adenosyltransferase
MSIVTKKGDNGFTDFPDYKSGGKNTRVRKDDARIECVGELDELDAFLSLAEIELQSCGNSRFADIMANVRETLFTAVMSAAANSTPAACLSAADIEWLEKQVALLEKENPFRGFVRSWTKPGAAALNIARTVCRRCERRMVSAVVNNTATHSPDIETAQAGALQWINRLSDLLFVLAVSAEKS